jgi:hypothetical protein
MRAAHPQRLCLLRPVRVILAALDFGEAADEIPAPAIPALLLSIVHGADMQDRDGGVLLMSLMFGLFPFLLSFTPTAAMRGRNSATV